MRSLSENKVAFVIIGASAFAVHGYSRSTLDIDLFKKPERGNAARTRSALKGFGYDVSEIAEQELLEKKILIRQNLVETDIHPFVKGVTFEEVWKGRVKGAIGGIEVFFAGLEELIKMKQAAGRPKNLEDLKILRNLLEKRKP